MMMNDEHDDDYNDGHDYDEDDEMHNKRVHINTHTLHCLVHCALTTAALWFFIFWFFMAMLPAPGLPPRATRMVVP